MPTNLLDPDRYTRNMRRLRPLEQTREGTYMTESHVQITLLTQAQCGFCNDAHETLRRLAREYPLEVTVLDIASPDGQTLAQRAGVVFPPGVLIEGASFSYGRLSERKLRRELEGRLHGDHTSQGTCGQ